MALNRLILNFTYISFDTIISYQKHDSGGIDVMKDFKEMLSKIFILNLFLGVFIFLLIKSIFKVQLGTYFLIGLVVATVNLFINSIGTKLAMEKEKRSYLTLLSFVLRVSLVLLSVVVVCKSNFQNVIFLLLGYSLNFISITIYGIGLGRNKA